MSASNIGIGNFLAGLRGKLQAWHDDDGKEMKGLKNAYRIGDARRRRELGEWDDGERACSIPKAAWYAVILMLRCEAADVTCNVPASEHSSLLRL